MTQPPSPFSLARLLKRLLLGVLGGVLLALLIVLLSIPVSRFERPGDLLAVKPSGRWLLDDVHLVDVNTGATLPDQQLLIDNGRIAQIRAAGTPAADGEHVIDGHGAWVTPGLFDLKRTPDGPPVATLKLWSVGTEMSSKSRIRVEFPDGTDAQTKYSATMAALFFIAVFINQIVAFFD